MKGLPERWLRGDVSGVTPLLQPVAHALLQARDEVQEQLSTFPVASLWEKPAGVASVGFHLRHMRGVLHRLLTYARGEDLTAEQLRQLRDESTPGDEDVDTLLTEFGFQVDEAMRQLQNTAAESLRDPREVGRARLPSTVQGLLFHAAEHTMRHTGQLLVTSRVLTNTRPTI